VIYADIPTDDQIKAASVVLIFTGRPYYPDIFKPPFCQIEGEGFDHPYILPQDDLINRCVNLNPRTVVNIVSGCGTQMDWADKAGAILQVFFGGQTGADALLDVLTGTVNPSGKLPMSIEKRFEDSCAAGYLDAKPQTNITDPTDLAKRAKHNFGGLWMGDKNTKAFTYDVNYAEGIFMGYRWYDEKKIEPRFPFGFGLSYTTFAYSDLKLAVPQVTIGTPVQASVTVKNTGQVAGTEVVELYVSEEQPKVPRPVRELKGFQRVALQPGESKTISLVVAPEAFSYYDEASHGWQTDAGAFDIEVGASSRDIRLKQQVNLTR
jgi:beta-glucosidase